MEKEYHGLVIKKKWLDMILNGSKKLEIRGCDTKKRGTILLIESGGGNIIGCTDLYGTICLQQSAYDNLKKEHKVDIPYESLPYQRVYGWQFRNAVRFQHPIPYTHPKGAIRWIRIKENKEIDEELKNSGVVYEYREL